MTSLRFVHLMITFFWATQARPSGQHDQTLQQVDAFGVPIECIVRDFNFTATVTDRNGKKCRGLVRTKACFGSCESYEIGTFQFPWVLRVQPVCNYAEIITRIVRLRDCEKGADRNAAFYRFPEAKSCGCQNCDKKNHVCQPAPTSPLPERVDTNELANQQDSSERQYQNDYSNDEPSFSEYSLLGQLISSERRKRGH